MKLSFGVIGNENFVKIFTFLQIYEYFSIWLAESGSGSQRYVVDCS